MSIDRDLMTAHHLGRPVLIYRDAHGFIWFQGTGVDELPTFKVGDVTAHGLAVVGATNGVVVMIDRVLLPSNIRAMKHKYAMRAMYVCPGDTR